MACGGFLSFQTEQTPTVLENNLSQIRIETEDTLVFARPRGASLPTVQIARWKDGYVVFYVNSNWVSKYFFTNAQFEKQGKEYVVLNRMVYQVVTENNEIALLAGNKSSSGSSPRSDHAYFMTVSENGAVLRETLIVGAENVNKGDATELDDWGNYQMRWTGAMYVTFFPVQHNFRKLGPPDVHQGDCMYFIPPLGDVIAYSDWGASHSFEQRLVIGDKFIATAAKGDAYPRGMQVTYTHLSRFELLPFDKKEKDMNNKGITHYYEPHQQASSVPLKVSGASGANYVPFTLGDIVMLDSNSALVSFSSKDKKAAHDLGIVRSHLGKSTGLKYLSNSPTIAEHSVRMTQVGKNRILIFWKEFDTRKTLKQLKILRKEIGGWYPDRTIFSAHNMDQNKMALIDSTGKFLVKPQKISNANWYYNAGLKESSNPWFSVIQNYAHHSYSPFFTTAKGATAWAYHGHQSKVIEVYQYQEKP